MKNLLFCITFTTIFLTGCGNSYVAPAIPDSFTHAVNSLSENPASEDIGNPGSIGPLAQSPLPARIAYARIGQSRNGECSGRESMCLVSVREWENQTMLDRVLGLNQLDAIAPLSDSLVFGSIDSDFPLRQAAGRLNANLLLIFGMNSSTRTENTDLGPLEILSLGFLQNRKIHVRATANASLIDVATGRVLATFEGTGTQDDQSSSWSEWNERQDALTEAEAKAFKQMADQFVTAWPTIILTFAHQPSEPVEPSAL